MKTPLLIAGIFAMLTGLIWFGQGTGYFPYPASSFMVRQGQWAYYGAGLMLLGLVMIAFARRK